MTAPLTLYGNDGASTASKIVLAMIQEKVEGEFYGRLDALTYLNVDRWNNGRERGYVISFKSRRCFAGSFKQQNIAFYEARSSDDIVVVEYFQNTMNPPTFTDRGFEEAYDRADTNHFGYKSWANAADYIFDLLERYLGEIETANEKGEK